MYCIYELVCPNTLLVKYVGMSKNIQDRYRAHKRGDEKSTSNFFESLKKSGLVPVLKIRLWNLDKKEAIQKECEIIMFYKNIGQCDLNTYIGHVPLTKKDAIILSDRQLKMKNTRKIMCQGGKEKERLVGYNEKRKISIVDQFNKVYKSMRECERLTGCHRVSIKKVLLGKYRQTNGYLFKLTGEV